MGVKSACALLDLSDVLVGSLPKRVELIPVAAWTNARHVLPMLSFRICWDVAVHIVLHVVLTAGCSTGMCVANFIYIIRVY